MGILNIIFDHNKRGNKLERTIRKDIKRIEKKIRQEQARENSEGEAKATEELGFLYFNQGLFDEATDYWKQALRIYQDTNNRRSMAEAYSNIGTAYRLQGKLDSAARLYHKALTIDQQFNPGVSELKSFHNLGGTLMELKESDNAQDTFKEALEIAERLKDKKWIALTLFRLGQAFLDSGQFREAFECFDRSSRVAESESLLDILTECTLGMGTCYEMLGDYSQAIPCYMDARDGAKKLGDGALEARINIALSKLYFHIGFFDESRNISRKASEVIPESAPANLKVELLLLRARLYAHQGMAAKALKMLKMAESLAENFPTKYHIALVLLQRAHLEVESGRYENAKAVMFQMAGKFPEGKSAIIDLESALLFGKIYRGMNDKEKALHAREAAVLKAQYLGCPRYLWSAYHSLGRFYHYQMWFSRAQDQYETALKWLERSAASLDSKSRKVFIEYKPHLKIYENYVALLYTTSQKELAVRVLKKVNSEKLNRKIQHIFNKHRATDSTIDDETIT